MNYDNVIITWTLASFMLQFFLFPITSIPYDPAMYGGIDKNVSLGASALTINESALEQNVSILSQYHDLNTTAELTVKEKSFPTILMDFIFGVTGAVISGIPVLGPAIGGLILILSMLLNSYNVWLTIFSMIFKGPFAPLSYLFLTVLAFAQVLGVLLIIKNFLASIIGGKG